ncbi:MAG: S8 family peptidase, partial [Candidatus Hodarchaeales archaeon]
MRRQLGFNRNRFILLVIIIISISGGYSRSAAILSENKIESSFLGKSSSLIDEKLNDFPKFYSEVLIKEGVLQIMNDEEIDDYFTSILDLINPITEEPGFTGKNTTIAILDSGINYSSWINSGKIINRSVIAENTPEFDEIGHGTQVASIISKIAPDSELISIKVSDQYGKIENEYVDAGIRLARSLNASIIHASIGSPDIFSVNTTLIEELSGDNITLVFSAGNDGPFGMSLTSPAILDNVIAVGMAFNQTHVPYSTSVGPRPSGLLGPDILAPGVYIPSYSNMDEAVNKTGTSYAAPFITAGVALLREAFPTASPTLLKTAIVASAHLLNTTSPIRQGNGFFDLKLAYQMLTDLNSTPILFLTPKVISSDFAYFGHSINGQERIYRIGLYSSNNTKFIGMNVSELDKILADCSLVDGTNISHGYTTFNLSIMIPKNLPMETWRGNITFNFENTSTKIFVEINNKYPGGKVLFYQGFDNDSFIPDGPTGTFSQLRFFLENYFGMQVTGLVRSSLGVTATDPLSLDVDNRLTKAELDNYDILVLADLEFNITDPEINAIRDWVADGHSLLVLSYSSLVQEGTEFLSNAVTINQLLDIYGISIKDDSTKPRFDRFTNATVSSSSIFAEDDFTFDYNGTEVEIQGNEAHVLATATDLLDGTSTNISAYWEDGASKVIAFGGMTPFFDLSFFSPNYINNYQVVSRLFSWIILDQQNSLEIILT